MNSDLLTIISTVLSFGVFFWLHLIACRRLRPEQLLSSLLKSSIVATGFPIVFLGGVYLSGLVTMPLQIWVCVTVLSFLLFILAGFVYILCIFGPYETSVRMRLVREIAQAKEGGMTAEELDRRYNAKIIMGIRLRRLTGSGYLVEKDGVYRMGKTTNMFFLFDIIAGTLKFLIGKKD